jgi:hypothetical protein
MNDILERMRRDLHHYDGVWADRARHDVADAIAEIERLRALVGPGTFREHTTLADAVAQLANVSGALADAGVIVPSDPWQYGAAAGRIRAHVEREIAAHAKAKADKLYDDAGLGEDALSLEQRFCADTAASLACDVAKSDYPRLKPEEATP